MPEDTFEIREGMRIRLKPHEGTAEAQTTMTVTRVERGTDEAELVLTVQIHHSS